MKPLVYSKANAELRYQKTLVPGVESQWIICLNNPVRYVDPTGLTTELNENTGEILKVYNDSSTKILAFPYVGGQRASGPPSLVGESLEWDSFVSSDTGKPVGKVYPGQSIDKYIDNLIQKASGYGKDKTFVKTRPGSEFDIKSQYPGHEGKSYHGFLFRGKYVTLREGGNILAGMNAAQFGMTFDEFQQGAGALHAAGVFGVTLHNIFGKTYGTSPMWGEIPYQYTRSQFGYNLYNKEN